MGADAPAFSERLAAPPRHEWLELVKYWNGGGRGPVWFVADPLRSDLALVHHGGAARVVPLAAPFPRAHWRRSAERDGLVRARSAGLVSRRGLGADARDRRRRRSRRGKGPASRREPGVDPAVGGAAHADDWRPPAAGGPAAARLRRLDRRPHRGGTGHCAGLLPADARPAGRRAGGGGRLCGAGRSRRLAIASRSSSSTRNRQARSCTGSARDGTSTNTTRRPASCGAGPATVPSIRVRAGGQGVVDPHPRRSPRRGATSTSRSGRARPSS